MLLYVYYCNSSTRFLLSLEVEKLRSLTRASNSSEPRARESTEHKSHSQTWKIQDECGAGPDSVHLESWCLEGRGEGKFKVSRAYAVSYHSQRKKGLAMVISFPFLLF